MELTRSERQMGLRDARDAARQARKSMWRTAESQYRRYRSTVGDAYLAWPQWHAEYLRTYRGRNAITTGAANPWGGMPPGGIGVGGVGGP
ncbi:hypothetical protein K7711_22120 [Nocardia sp. CA2R105]|uniref:hypothetical protein n=1 Tax=Nocardia coffeae TaxID=2873381 RepID=UPI001CA6F886|nr:hypothetical protein [Nocardia coffeae]MBY8859187.1 hypothetical protein [Nocardia coffeae]